MLCTEFSDLHAEDPNGGSALKLMEKLGISEK
jgi:hypothetical protein